MLSVSIDRWKERVQDEWPAAQFTRVQGAWVAHIGPDVYGNSVGVYVPGGQCGVCKTVDENTIETEVFNCTE